MSESSGVASVVLDVPLAHLDRPFDYAVPPELADSAVPGARVAVRFAGRDAGGFVVARTEVSEHPGKLTPIRRVVSALPVLTPEALWLARAVADHYGGTLADVLRLAVPPRHGATESAVLARRAPDPAADGGPDPRAEPGPRVAEPGSPEPEPGPWSAYSGGEAFLRRVAAGEGPRAVWTALPGAGVEAPEVAVSAAVAACVRGGRGAVVVVPDGRDVDRFGAALARAGVPFARLTAEQGPAARYRAFLNVLLGRVPVALGTRSAAFAPVRAPGLVVLWDDGDDLLVEPRAPYPEARTVLALRAERTGAAALLGAYARSTGAQVLLESGWARELAAPRSAVRSRTPRVAAPGPSDLAREGPAARARIPHAAWAAIKVGLAQGPVLVQVPRAGYVPVTACENCRAPAACAHCRGPLRLASSGGVPACGWCGRPAADWRCGSCGHGRLRARRIGSERTTEELGRAFPGVPVASSGASAPGGVVTEVPGEARVVVATPGAEPRAEGGYAAAVLLDAWLTGGPVGLWLGEEALRRWLNAAALVRPAGEGGRVLLLGDPAPVPAQALVRWDPAGFAARELEERRQLRLPPAVPVAAVEGTAAAVSAFLGHLEPPPGIEILGPVPVDRDGGEVRALVRPGPAGAGVELGPLLARAAATRSARKEPGSVRVRFGPRDLW